MSVPLLITGFLLGMICSLGAALVYNDSRGIPWRRVPPALIMSAGFGIIIGADTVNGGTTQVLGLFVIIGGVWTGVRLSVKRKQREQTAAPSESA